MKFDILEGKEKSVKDLPRWSRRQRMVLGQGKAWKKDGGREGRTGNITVYC